MLVLKKNQPVKNEFVSLRSTIYFMAYFLLHSHHHFFSSENKAKQMSSFLRIMVRAAPRVSSTTNMMKAVAANCGFINFDNATIITAAENAGSGSRALALTASPFSMGSTMHFEALLINLDANDPGMFYIRFILSIWLSPLISNCGVILIWGVHLYFSSFIGFSNMFFWRRLTLEFPFFFSFLFFFPLFSVSRDDWQFSPRNMIWECGLFNPSQIWWIAILFLLLFLFCFANMFGST